MRRAVVVDTNFDNGVVTDRLPNANGVRTYGREIQGHKIRARRDIVTEYGFIAKGETGFVPASWVQKVISGGCSCRGSVNWFTFI
jgi:hypothetical protein